MFFHHWTINNGSQKYLLVVDQNYVGKLRADQNLSIGFYNQLQNGTMPESTYKIPVHYIKKIVHRENTPVIQLHFGKDSREEYRIEEEGLRYKVLQALKGHPGCKEYRIVRYNFIRATKRSLIAAALLAAVFGWAYQLANQLEQGLDVGPNLIFILALAGLGTQSILVVSLIIALILAGVIIAKGWKLPVEHVLVFGPQ